MRKYDRCHYVWQLAWRGLALSPVWDTPPVPKLASHECERRPGEGAEQWGARGGTASSFGEMRICQRDSKTNRGPAGRQSITAVSQGRLAEVPRS